MVLLYYQAYWKRLFNCLDVQWQLSKAVYLFNINSISGGTLFRLLMDKTDWDYKVLTMNLHDRQQTWRKRNKINKINLTRISRIYECFSISKRGSCVPRFHIIERRAQRSRCIYVQFCNDIRNQVILYDTSTAEKTCFFLRISISPW